MQNLNEIVMRGQGFKGPINEPGPVAANTSNMLRAEYGEDYIGYPLSPFRACRPGDGCGRGSPGRCPAAAPEAAPPSAAPAAPAAEAGEPIKLQDNPPSRYTVKRGDTLWGISGRFLKNPWKWPDIWGVNKDLVKNPHLIYPGDVIILDLTGATPRLRLEGMPDGGLSRWYGYELQVTKVEPRIRSQSSRSAIPTIAAKDLEPFLIRPLVLDPDAIARSPRIVATADSRVVMFAAIWLMPPESTRTRARTGICTGRAASSSTRTRRGTRQRGRLSGRCRNHFFR